MRETNIRGATRGRIYGIGAAAMLLVVGVGGVHWRFGSVPNAAAYLKGDAVRVEQPIRELGTVKCDEQVKVAFNVVNLQREPLKVVGANASCSCILPPEMPFTLDPFLATPLVFTFTSPSAAMPFTQDIELYFDGPIPAMTLKISGVTIVLTPSIAHAIPAQPCLDPRCGTCGTVKFVPCIGAGCPCECRGAPVTCYQ
jgi:hypothetical protein